MPAAKQLLAIDTPLRKTTARPKTQQVKAAVKASAEFVLNPIFRIPNSLFG
jgi:hypothetical protein